MAAPLESVRDASRGLPVKPVPLTNGHAPAIKLEEDEKHQLVLRVFRCLIADLCEQFNGGHPGGAIGMAAIGVALFKYVMKYSPNNANYFNRDRFLLSNGHTCLFQYTFLHLVGYKSMTLDQLKSYHSDRTDSITPGHPEIENEGIEVTTGPLGQGVANAVGLAMATKQLGATYNKPDVQPLVDNHTWCMLGDACLQEGVALEAIQLAGHWKLNNLTLIYDNNQVTCDGTVDMVCTEDIDAKMRACGFKVIDVADGTSDVYSVVRAMVEARASDLPTFINVRTVIGVGSNVQGQAVAHGVNFGRDATAEMKRSLGLDPEEHFYVPKEVYDFFHEPADRGDRYEAEWAERRKVYARKYPEEAKEFDLRVQGKMPQDWKQFVPAPGSLGSDKLASRKSGGKVLSPLMANMKNFLVGTADLSPSVNLMFKDQVDFQNPELRTTCGSNGGYGGRYIHYGIREHAMAAISNGLAAFNRGTFLPFTSSFFMFYIYAAAGVRMGALQSLQVIHVATHDSIGGGPDGPTHQPVELAALYRAMPNILYFRPCDGEEVAGAYIAAIEATESPSIVSLSRHGLKQWPQHSRRDGVAKGAYVFIEEEGADVTLLGVGSELEFAVEAREVLREKHGVKARVVSFPCQRLFDRQSREYRRKTLGLGGKTPIVAIEAYSPTGWERYADAGINMGSFGKSLPEFHPYGYFGFEGSKIAEKVAGFLGEVKKEGIESFRGDFQDLNGSLASMHAIV